MQRVTIRSALPFTCWGGLLIAAGANGSDIDALRAMGTPPGEVSIIPERSDSPGTSSATLDPDFGLHEWCAFAFDPTVIDAGALEDGAPGDGGAIAARPGAASSDASRVTAAPVGSSRFGAAGSWRWQIIGGGGIGTDSISNGQLGAGVSWFVVDDLSIDVQVNADYFNQSGPSAWGGDVELLFRWHFLARDTWSLYVDGGCGLMWTSHDVPPDSATFNFTPQAGAGATWEIATDTRLMLGARWFHVSNANTASPNPSYNGVFVYAGVSFGF
jgi:hypothetical protein